MSEFPPNQSGIHVWDVPTRIFHWSLLAAVVTSLASEELGEMDIHLISGHVVLGLVMFRVMWGFFGGRHARFTDFVRGPAAVISYAHAVRRGETPLFAGHNPLGALSVIALIGILTLQVSTGLFSNDDIFTEGPLAKLVDKATSDQLTGIHGLLSNVLYVLIALHISAIAFYRYVKGERLVKAMVTGHKEEMPSEHQAPGTRGNLILAAAAAAIAATAAVSIFTY